MAQARAQARPRVQERPAKATDDLAGPALRAFFGISDLWKLSNREQIVLLGSPKIRTFYNWKKDKDGHLPKDTLERISYLLGIYQGLQILLPNTESADSWVRKPNSAPIFGGNSALDLMLSGNVADLYRVRRYLDSARGGWG